MPIPLAAVGVVDEFNFDQRFAVVDVASGRVRMVSPPGLYAYEFDWSPDGKQIVATAAPPPGNNGWYSAQLYIVDVDSGEMKSILKPGMQIQVPRWSPDAKHIAFIGGLMSGRSIAIGDVYVILLESGRTENLTPQTKASARRIFWVSANRLLLTEFVHGQSGLAEVDITQGKVNQLWTGTEFSSEGAGFGNFSVANDGRSSALDLQSFQRPPEVWAGPIGAWKQVTHYNEELHPAWGKVESLEWKSDEWNIQGWLYYPRNYDPHARFPMIVYIHGGPAYLQPAIWGGDPAELAGAGYFVLCPNARGSVGEGEAFAKANVRDVGHGDWRDILAGVDKVLATLPIDKNRLGISGWSYGGYMTMWAVTQTAIFRAAVAGAGISDWLSYAGQCDYPRWVEGHFAASVYDDPLIYAQSSPMNYVKDVKTPTLILVGAGDGVCPPPQSFEFWRALRTRGVKTQLVQYPDEGHMIIKPEHRRDVNQRTIDWFNELLK
jgi:dipeptidyl aminopeptidase/acylaminoacyl peptidase